MFIKLEVFNEQNQQPFGEAKDALLNMKGATSTFRMINLATIQSFEPIKITTSGRPGTFDNKGDCLAGIRIQLADGTTTVMINDKDPTFLRALEAARKSDKILYHHGQSNYMSMFAPLTSEADASDEEEGSAPRG